MSVVVPIVMTSNHSIFLIWFGLKQQVIKSENYTKIIFFFKNPIPCVEIPKIVPTAPFLSEKQNIHLSFCLPDAFLIFFCSIAGIIKIFEGITEGNLDSVLQTLSKTKILIGPHGAGAPLPNHLVKMRSFL